MKKLFYSFGFALNGIGSSFKSELNLRIHFLVMVFLIPAGFYFSIGLQKWLVLLFCMGLVLAMELVNTAIEKLCDIVHPGKHPAIGKVKDISAGAVLLSAVIAAICGAIIFIPEFISLLK